MDVTDPNTRATIGGILIVAWTLFTYFFPKPKKGAGSRVWISMQQSLRRVGGVRVFVWFVGICLLAALGYGIILRMQPVLLVCTGQFEGGCGKHDMFVGCYGLPTAEKICWHYKNLGLLSEVHENSCSYHIYRVRCGSGFF
jgi:hypothetical protein